MTPNDLQQEIRLRLAILEPGLLDIRDDSAMHAGHVGSTGGGHFSLTLVSSQFYGKSQIMRHRAIYQALQDLIPNFIHALSITARAPGES
jgi:BolA family transcriptional regulator, general stress-responsive regulator